MFLGKVIVPGVLVGVVTVSVKVTLLRVFTLDGPVCEVDGILRCSFRSLLSLFLRRLAARFDSRSFRDVGAETSNRLALLLVESLNSLDSLTDIFSRVLAVLAIGPGRDATGVTVVIGTL